MNAAPPLPTRRWDRGAWATVLFVVAFTLFSATVSALALRQPSDGCTGVFDGAGYSFTIERCYGDWPTPLRPGDTILAVGSIPFSADLDFSMGMEALPAGWGEGATIDYSVRRGDATITLPVPVERLSWRGVANVFAATAWMGDPVATISEYLLYLSAALIFALAPRSAAARLLLVSAGLHFAVTKLGWGGWPLVVANRLMQGPLFYVTTIVTSFWIWGFWPSLLLLLLSFPRPVWPLSRARALTVALIYGVPAFAVLSGFVTGDALPYLLVLVGQFVLLLVAMVAIPIHTFLRLRDPVVRAQTGWLLLGLACYVAPIALLYPILLFNPDAADAPLLNASMAVLSPLTGLGLPLCLGIAILRYRLFDIEIIIRRTLLYSLLTIVLAAVYFVSVVLLQRLFVQLTGEESTLAVVASTLAIAALFGPLRGVVQRFIDRRFFRRKYDARLVLEQFARRAQQDADLDALSADLLATVDETLKPDHTTLWLVHR